MNKLNQTDQGAEAEVDLEKHADETGMEFEPLEADPCLTDVRLAKEHIYSIRRSKGLESASSEEASANVKDLEKALEVLSDQLYTQPTHFLLEFIQNADDNSYTVDTPTISFARTNGHLRIECNETGFAPSNIDAICRIGSSTKTDRSKGFIGEKGIGFKSVFKIADVVWVSSNGYCFKFDRHKPLGMIAPIWEEFPLEVKPAMSQFYLQLTKDAAPSAEEDLIKQLYSLDSTLLLFLRKLTKIEIFVDHKDWKRRLTSFVTRKDTIAYGGEVITITKSWTKTKKARENSSYLVVRHTTEGMPAEQRRRGIQSSEVVLAFPFSNGGPDFYSQQAYAFLPIRESGFKVSEDCFTRAWDYAYNSVR